MTLRASGDTCPIPLGLGMALLPWLADEDLLGPAGAGLGSLVAEEEGCNEDGRGAYTPAGLLRFAACA